VNLGSDLEGVAKKKAKRFMNLLALEGPEAAKCDIKGIPVPEPESDKLPIAEFAVPRLGDSRRPNRSISR